MRRPRLARRSRPRSYIRSVTPKPTDERRAQARGAPETKATGLIQKILADPSKAADDLEAEVRTGGDATMMSALLSAAESLGKLRGLDLKPQIAKMRTRLRAAGF